MTPIAHVFNVQAYTSACKNYMKSTTCRDSTTEASCLSLITIFLKALRSYVFSDMSLMKRMSKKMFDYRLLSRTAKSPIFSTISFAAIFFLIYADTIVSNLSGNHHEILDPHQTQKSEAPALMESTLTTSTAPLIPAQEKVDGEEDSETQDPLIPPDNVSREERLNWFRRKLPELEILKSNDLSQKFHGRVLEFFNHGCSVQFYMTWFSTARSFGKRGFLAVDTLFKVHPEGCLTQSAGIVKFNYLIYNLIQTCK